MNNSSNAPAKNRAHSKLGVISHGFVVVNITIAVCLYAGNFILNVGKDQPQGIGDGAFSVIVFVLSVAPLLNLTGLILGVIGVFMQNTKKIFPVLGIILNILGLMIFVLGWLGIIGWIGLSGGAWR